LFSMVKEGTYFVNSPCILAKNHLITTGQTYLFAEYPGSNESALAYVLLKDVVLIDGFIMMHLVDMLTKYEWWLNELVEQCEERCEWMLLDPVYIIERMGKNMASKHDDKLLEFDF
jgi:hypothetical protein